MSSVADPHILERDPNPDLNLDLDLEGILTMIRFKLGSWLLSGYELLLNFDRLSITDLEGNTLDTLQSYGSGLHPRWGGGNRAMQRKN